MGHGNIDFPRNFYSTYSPQIQVILSFNNQCLSNKEKTKSVPTQLEKCFEVATARQLEMSNQAALSFHIKAVRPPLLLCLSFAVLNLPTRSFIALQETNTGTKAFINYTWIQYYICEQK